MTNQTDLPTAGLLNKRSSSGSAANSRHPRFFRGQFVETRNVDEIQATLDSYGKNCGLSFEPDMLEYCGRRFEVDFPVRKIIFEETGRMVDLTHTVALKGVFCQGLCAKNCPRSNPLYW